MHFDLIDDEKILIAPVPSDEVKSEILFSIRQIGEILRKLPKTGPQKHFGTVRSNFHLCGKILDKSSKFTKGHEIFLFADFKTYKHKKGSSRNLWTRAADESVYDGVQIRWKDPCPKCPKMGLEVNFYGSDPPSMDYVCLEGIFIYHVDTISGFYFFDQSIFD